MAERLFYFANLQLNFPSCKFSGLQTAVRLFFEKQGSSCFGSESPAIRFIPTLHPDRSCQVYLSEAGGS